MCTCWAVSHGALHTLATRGRIAHAESIDQKTNPSTMVQLASEFNPKARNEAKQYGEKKEEVSG